MSHVGCSLGASMGTHVPPPQSSVQAQPSAVHSQSEDVQPTVMSHLKLGGQALTTQPAGLGSVQDASPPAPLPACPPLLEGSPPVLVARPPLFVRPPLLDGSPPEARPPEALCPPKPPSAWPPSPPLDVEPPLQADRTAPTPIADKKRNRAPTARVCRVRAHAQLFGVRTFVAKTDVLPCSFAPREPTLRTKPADSNEWQFVTRMQNTAKDIDKSRASAPGSLPAALALSTHASSTYSRARWHAQRQTAIPLGCLPPLPTFATDRAIHCRRATTVSGSRRAC